MDSDNDRRPRWSRRRAWLVIAAWVFLIGALTSFAPSLDSVKTDDDNNPPADSMSMRAAALAEQELGTDDSPPAVVVVRSDSVAVTRTVTSRIASEITGAGLPAVRAVRVGGTPAAGEPLTATVLVTMSGNPSEERFRTSVDEIRSIAAGAAGDDAEALVTGPAGIAVDAVKVFSGSDKVLLFGTLGLVVALLFGIYRSPGLVVVSLLGVGVALRLAEGVGALLAQADAIRISGQTASIMTVLLFGVGTDYALIIFSRYREHRAESPDPRLSVAAAMRSVAGALAASVSTIVAAVLVLLTAITPTLHDFGPYLAVGVGSMAVVAFTLTPALLVVAGRLAFWPRRALGTPPESGTWSRVAALVLAAPRRVLAGSLAGLVLMCGGLIGVQQSFDLVSGFRIDTDSAAGQRLLGEAFGPGSIAPSQVLVRAEAPMGESQTARVARALAATPGVDRTTTVRSAEDRRTAAVDVVLDANPYGSEAMDLLPALVETAEEAARAAGVTGPEALVAGETAIAADTRTALDRDLVVVGLTMLLAVAVILGLVLRSLLAPLYLSATLVLTYAATMGATAFVTLRLGSDLGIGNRVAVYVLVFLIALGVDYTIFMMTRYRQELGRREPLDALRTSIVRTGGVISSAGVILAGTFAVLMTQPIRELYQFGLAMGIGILVDTFVVRPLLVPACIRLLGRHALWPGRTAR